MIELYAGGTPNVYKVLLMLAECGLPYTLKRVNVQAGEQFAPGFTALNPNAKIPVITDSDGPGGAPHTVFESGAILLYLARKTGRFLPAGAAAESTVMQWLMWQMASQGPMFGQALHFKYVAPAGSEYGRTRYLTEVQRLADVAETRLGAAPWLGGADYSIADMAAWPWFAKYHRMLHIDLAARPRLAAWITAIEQRPAYAAIDGVIRDLFKGDMAATKAADLDALDRFFGRGRWVRT
jgi:GST-like protein